MMRAIITRDERFIRYLIHKGANVNTVTPDGKKALRIAIQQNTGRRIIDLLVSHGATLDGDGAKELKDAIEHNYWDSIIFLIERNRN